LSTSQLPPVKCNKAYTNSSTGHTDDASQLTSPRRKVICFTRADGIKADIRIGYYLHQVETKVRLGVTLDRQLTFAKHADNVAGKAYGALTQISALMADIGGMQMEIGTSL
jgi:hypothetical protein